MRSRLRWTVRLSLLAGAALMGCVPGLWGPRASVPVDLKRGPISVFEGTCTTCHGSYREFYRKDIRRLSDARLREVVDEMMRQRAKLPATQADVEAMVAYHRALRGEALFVCITNGAEAASGGKELRGEVTRGAAVEVRKDGASRAASVRGSQWTLARPPASPFLVVVRKGDIELRLPFPSQQWTFGGRKPP